MIRLLAALVALVPALALAGERILVVKTYDDARFPANMETCLSAGFTPLNVVLGASVWSLETSIPTGEVKREAVRFLGTATGCGQLTNPTPFTPKQGFLIRFDLADGTYVAKGECDIVSVSVPTNGIMLAGCALSLVSAPEGVIGGIATSASIFNPAGIPGFGTGSVWTLHLYTDDASPARGDRPRGRGR